MTLYTIGYTQKSARQFFTLLKKAGSKKDDLLLCSEHLPHACHRSLVAAYLQRHWGKMEIVHIF